MRRTAGWGAAGVLALGLLTGCGGEKAPPGVASVGGTKGGAKPSATPTLSREDAQLKFAQCMRKHGIKMDDPGANGGQRVTMRGKRGEGAPDKMQAAMKECQPILQQGGMGPPDMKDPKVRDQMLKFAQCMRKNGVDMPDPSPDGGFMMKRKPGDDPKKMEAAQKACEQFQPKRPDRP